MARETVPRFPLSLPVMIRTVSPFLIFILARWRGFFSFCFVAIFYSSLKHFRRKRNNLHEVSFAQFAGNRAKDTCASWVITGGNNHGSILVKTDMRTIRPRILLCHAHYHSIDDFTLFDLSVGRSLLHRGLDNVPYLRITLGRTAHYANTHNLFGTSIIGDLQACLWLYHLTISLLFCFTGFVDFIRLK